jgi:molybdenum cofactor synthesis domain-containing protein
MRVVILTVSDSTFDGDRSDTSGDAIRHWCERRSDTIVAHEHVADESSEIVPALVRWCDSGEVDLVITTGGTGLAPRDVTPEATRAVIDREAQGIAEFIRFSSFPHFPRAALSRGLAGVRGSTLIINLPGSTTGVADGLAAILPIIDHAVDVMSGKVKRHETALDTRAVR